jgi:peptide-methionine (R)-S-oxide reductase
MSKTMTPQEWQERLSEEEYKVLREKGTERAFSGAYWDEKSPGQYNCRACGDALFDSETKFDSGSGWPSFTAPVDGANVQEITDQTHGMTRVEVVCGNCESHLGHVFPDGPGPDGQRYCINSISLQHDERED